MDSRKWYARDLLSVGLRGPEGLPTEVFQQFWSQNWRQLRRGYGSYDILHGQPQREFGQCKGCNLGAFGESPERLGSLYPNYGRSGLDRCLGVRFVREDVADACDRGKNKPLKQSNTQLYPHLVSSDLTNTVAIEMTVYFGEKRFVWELTLHTTL